MNQGTGSVGFPGARGILFAFELVFRATYMNSTWFGGSKLSEFAPATAHPFYGVRPLANPQVETIAIIWSSTHISRVSPKRLSGSLRVPRKPHIHPIFSTARQNLVLSD